MPTPRRMTLRQAQTARAEAPELDQDLALVKEVEALEELPFAWERAALEVASQRVYQLGRALMPKNREALLEILKRRGDKQASEGDE